MKLKNKTAIITGCGTGIGKAAALLFAQNGANVMGTDINEENGNQTVREINRLGGNAIFIQQDVSNEQNWERVVKETIGQFQTIDILFNNAGLFKLKPMLETTVEDWNKLMSVNVTGTFLGMKHVIPYMIKNKGGSIINISSTAAMIGASGHALYGATKGAVRTLTKHAAMEFGPLVRINSIYPGFIKTQMVEYAGKIANIHPEDQARNIPLKRLGTPQEVAQMVLYLSSEESSYITGAEFVLDGGLTVGQAVWTKEA